MKKIEDAELTRERLGVPVQLGEAARLLAKFYPRWSFGKDQLRRMCLIRSIPYIELPAGGMVRKYRFMIRVDDVVAWLKQCEVEAV